MPREVIDVAVVECGKQARRSGGKLPPHVVVYFVMAMALFAIDGMTFDVPDSAANAAEFGYGGGSAQPSAFPQVRVVTLVETATKAVLGAQLGPMSGKGSGERSLARGLFPLLARDMILLCDAGFYGFDDWCAAADTGAALLWRVGDTVGLPPVDMLPDGSYTSVVFAKSVSAARRAAVVEQAKAGADIDGVGLTPRPRGTEPPTPTTAAAATNPATLRKSRHVP